MKLKKLVAAFLGAACAVSAVAFAPASSAVPAISGETSRVESEIKLADGTLTGVTHTQINTSGYYGNNRVVNIAEGNLNDTNLSLEVMNCGKYITSKRTMTNAANEYNGSHSGQTVLAAVNGDLWMTGYHTHSGITKATLSATRGALIIDGEIWASEQIDQENLTATNAEKNTPAAEKTVMGVTSENQPVMGALNIRVNLSIGGRYIEADGINRLPAIDSIIVYNHRISSSNYALNDSFEVEIEVDDSALSLGESVTGKITAIYASGSSTRPSLSNSNTIVLTARGSRVSELSAVCAVGKTVSLTPTVVDKLGNTELWYDVEDAISGHMRVMHNGVGGPIPDNTYYPTALIGYKNDGTVSLVTVTSAFDKSRNALKISQSYDLCKELGFNSVFFLDGGGSATFVTLENNSYVVRNKCSDGSQRSVINGVGLVWNETPVAMRQGSLYHIKNPESLSAVSPVHMSGAMIYDQVTGPNFVTKLLDEASGDFGMMVNAETNDPFITLDYSNFQRVNADNYPYIVVKLRSQVAYSTMFTLFYSCGSDMGASGERLKSFAVRGGGISQTAVLNMSNAAGWTGNINNMRLDCFDSIVSKPGAAVYIESITLCRNMNEVNELSAGKLPDGACIDYELLLDSLRPTPDFKTGDVTGDGTIDMIDMYMQKLFLKNKETPELAEKYSADVNGDGDITMVDSFEMKYRIKKGQWRY